MIATAQLNALSTVEAEAGFMACCGARRWAQAMAGFRPFRDVAELHASADAAFADLTEPDWLEAFAAHPRIGETPVASRTEQWSRDEQRQVGDADDATRMALAQSNRDYATRFGFIFLVCATGKSAGDLLALLRARLDNGRDTEIRIAAGEQCKITHLRIDKWVQP